ncbi:YbaB/EbfC family nucleoid-associated protein [Actinomadura sp. NAK00032]|uniref:YbaB/EbfC family nucleoid-associated protein n=1 Tax=Actinomadura sp. NAK00032 TaxID=2742128 RepID=UPI001590DF05|nr:YbaB/EbfC family nucleoid-associated protein [Actinomadura sp. NAK00032]QKW38346.1 YbaB/EbfC family nucleoid-associated protein [Actinomadura sp. NAK00032]
MRKVLIVMPANDDPDEFLANLDKEAKGKLKKYRQLRTDLAQLEATAVSDDETVTVTVLPGGAVKDIKLSARAMRKQSPELEELLLTTIQQASAQVARQLAERVQESVGDAFDVVGMVNARLPEISLDDDPPRREGR